MDWLPNFSVNPDALKRAGYLYVRRHQCKRTDRSKFETAKARSGRSTANTLEKRRHPSKVIFPRFALSKFLAIQRTKLTR